jgi:hypothetical protein
VIYTVIEYINRARFAQKLTLVGRIIPHGFSSVCLGLLQ